jgi:type II secretory pathway pseudopilin PulG
MKRFTSRSGLTLIELILALGILAFLMLAVVQLLDRALDTWRAGETRRAVMEQAAVVTQLMTRDLRGIESGPRGDLLAEWVLFDTDGDGVKETKWPRLRLVREASGAEVARLKRDEHTDAPKTQVAEGEVELLDRASPEQVEIVWLVVPASTQDPQARSEGIVWRGERLVSDLSSKSFFDADFIGSSNQPPTDATDVVTGGLLWMNVMFAAQTSVVHDGWKISSDLSGAATSWDAWTKGRPDPQLHPWNEPQAGMPKARSRPLLPRRVRIELEFERPIDRRRRTELVDAIDNQVTVLRVDDGRLVPLEADSYILIDAEWMKVGSVDGDKVVVQRAQRGTTARLHAKSAMVHWGLRMVTETPVATYREDWNL